MNLPLYPSMYLPCISLLIWPRSGREERRSHNTKAYWLALSPKKTLMAVAVLSRRDVIEAPHSVTSLRNQTQVLPGSSLVFILSPSRLAQHAHAHHQKRFLASHQRLLFFLPLGLIPVGNESSRWSLGTLGPAPAFRERLDPLFLYLAKTAKALRKLTRFFGFRFLLTSGTRHGKISEARPLRIPTWTKTG